MFNATMTAIEFENLADEEEVPFEVCRVHNDQRGVRGGMFREAAAQRVTRHFFLRRGAFQAVKPGQIHEDHLPLSNLHPADPAFDGCAGKVGGFGAQPRQRVEERGLARVGISNQREREDATRTLRRRGRQFGFYARSVVHLEDCFRIAQWSGAQTSSHTRAASEADSPKRELKTRMMSGSPCLMTSIWRPTQTPSALSR